jgi:serine/threonine protein kinase
VIGKGSFGKVYLAVHKRDGKAYAVKVLTKLHIRKRNETRHLMSERNVLVLNIKHPFLVGLNYSFQTRGTHGGLGTCHECLFKAEYSE